MTAEATRLFCTVLAPRTKIPPAKSPPGQNCPRAKDPRGKVPSGDIFYCSGSRQLNRSSSNFNVSLPLFITSIMYMYLNWNK